MYIYRGGKILITLRGPAPGKYEAKSILIL